MSKELTEKTQNSENSKISEILIKNKKKEIIIPEELIKNPFGFEFLEIYSFFKIYKKEIPFLNFQELYYSIFNTKNSFNKKIHDLHIFLIKKILNVFLEKKKCLEEKYFSQFSEISFFLYKSDIDPQFKKIGYLLIWPKLLLDLLLLFPKKNFSEILIKKFIEVEIYNYQFLSPKFKILGLKFLMEIILDNNILMKFRNEIHNTIIMDLNKKKRNNKKMQKILKKEKNEILMNFAKNNVLKLKDEAKKFENMKKNNLSGLTNENSKIKNLEKTQKNLENYLKKINLKLQKVYEKYLKIKRKQFFVHLQIYPFFIDKNENSYYLIFFDKYSILKISKNKKIEIFRGNFKILFTNKKIKKKIKKFIKYKILLKTNEKEIEDLIFQETSENEKISQELFSYNFENILNNIFTFKNKNNFFSKFSKIFEVEKKIISKVFFKKLLFKIETFYTDHLSFCNYSVINEEFTKKKNLQKIEKLESIEDFKEFLVFFYNNFRLVYRNPNLLVKNNYEEENNFDYYQKTSKKNINCSIENLSRNIQNIPLKFQNDNLEKTQKNNLQKLEKNYNSKKSEKKIDILNNKKKNNLKTNENNLEKEILKNRKGRIFFLGENHKKKKIFISFLKTVNNNEKFFILLLFFLKKVLKSINRKTQYFKDRILKKNNKSKINIYVNKLLLRDKKILNKQNQLKEKVLKKISMNSNVFG